MADDEIDRTGWTPQEIEEDRLDRLTSPLFQMLLDFEHTFAAKALDELGLSDEDAEAMAKIIERAKCERSSAYAFFLRHVSMERRLRQINAQFQAVTASRGEAPVGGISLPELAAEYAKLSKGES